MSINGLFPRLVISAWYRCPETSRHFEGLVRKEGGARVLDDHGQASQRTAHQLSEGDELSETLWHQDRPPERLHLRETSRERLRHFVPQPGCHLLGRTRYQANGQEIVGLCQYE